MALPRDRRITTRREITRLLGGDRVRGQALELYWSPPAQLHSRATCITPKFGRTAVERNRLRRRLKELMRAILLGFPEPRDYLVRARPPAYDMSYAALGAALADLSARAAADGGGGAR